MRLILETWRYSLWHNQVGPGLEAQKSSIMSLLWSFMTCLTNNRLASKLYHTRCYLGYLGHYHGCWCLVPCTTTGPISNHGMKHAAYMGLGLPPRRISTCSAVLVFRKYWKCKCMFLPKINSAWQGLKIWYVSCIWVTMNAHHADIVNNGYTENMQTFICNTTYYI